MPGHLRFQHEGHIDAATFRFHLLKMIDHLIHRSVLQKSLRKVGGSKIAQGPGAAFIDDLQHLPDVAFDAAGFRGTRSTLATSRSGKSRSEHKGERYES